MDWSQRNQALLRDAQKPCKEALGRMQFFSISNDFGGTHSTTEPKCDLKRTMVCAPPLRGHVWGIAAAHILREKIYTNCLPVF